MLYEVITFNRKTAAAEKEIGIRTVRDRAVVLAKHRELRIVGMDVVSENRARRQESGRFIHPGVMRGCGKQFCDTGDFPARFVAVGLDIGVVPFGQYGGS